MNVTLSVDAEVERNLAARAHARGLSLDDYLQELLTREARISCDAGQPVRQFDNLSELLLNSPLAGANLDLERFHDKPAPLLH
jgi:hypothetical protein